MSIILFLLMALVAPPMARKQPNEEELVKQTQNLWVVG